jgi:two-component system, OmpR family, aerobic respiration control sensor histidine kinase ArcB
MQICALIMSLALTVQGSQNQDKSMEQKTEVSISDIFASLPGHIYAKDKNGVYLAANDRDEFCCALDGTKKGSELVGKTDKDFPWKDVAEALQRNDQAVMSSGKTQVFIEQGKLKNREFATFVSIKAPLRNQKGDIIGIVGNSIELTGVIDKLQ